MAFDRDKVLRTAQTYVQKKRYDKAIAEYQRIVQHDPNDVRTLLKIGDLQARLEAYGEAIATYERVARYYADQGFSLKAIAVYKQIREIIAKHVPYLADRYSHITPKLAELFTQLGLVSDALAAYDEIAVQYQKAGRDRDAIDILRKIVSLEPANPLHHLRLAEALSRIRDIDGAIQQFAIAAEILIKLGRPNDALKVLERLLHHRPDARYAKQAAELYLARAQGNDGMLALAKLQICFQANPKDLETLGLLAKAFIVIDQPAKAIEVEKEMARLAFEQGRQDVFERIIADLRRKAPTDPVVQRLAAHSSGHMAAVRPPARPAPPPPPSRAAADSEEVIELEDVDAEIIQEAPELSVAEGKKKDEQAAQADLSQYTSTVLADADLFRSQGLLTRAAEVLKAGIERQPRSEPLRKAYYEVLLEMGSYREAVEQMLELASLALDALDAEGAIGYLLGALQIVPDHPQALELLAELGYSPQPEAAPAQQAAPATPAAPPAAIEEEPLPAYELEEDVDVVEITDFEEEAAPAAAEAPLPSFPLESEEAPHAAPTVADSRAFTGSESVESALEEAEFFASRGLYEDALSVLEEQLARTPDHPAVLAKLREVEAAFASQQMGGSGPRERPQGMAGAASDIALELDLLDIIPEPRPEVEGADEQVDVEEVFAKFKEGVRKQIDESDSATHYDLGVAYQEMGLFPDAIEEFEIAARDPRRACISHSMVAAIHRSQNNFEAALKSYTKALAAEHKTVEQELSILYELGDLSEAMRDIPQAIAWFERLAERTPSYEDPRGSVQDRLDALCATMPNRSRAIAVNDIDDLDAAFDAIVKAD